MWENGGAFDFSLKEPKEWEKYYFNYQPVQAIDGPYADGVAARLATHHKSLSFR